MLCVVTKWLDALRPISVATSWAQSAHRVRSHAERGNENMNHLYTTRRSYKFFTRIGSSSQGQGRFQESPYFLTGCCRRRFAPKGRWRENTKKRTEILIVAIPYSILISSGYMQIFQINIFRLPRWTDSMNYLIRRRRMLF